MALDTIDGAALKGLPAGSKPGKAAMIGFRIESAGIYGVALDQGGWIDVLPGAEGGTALASVGTAMVRNARRFARSSASGSSRAYIASMSPALPGRG